MLRRRFHLRIPVPRGPAAEVGPQIPYVPDYWGAAEPGPRQPEPIGGGDPNPVMLTAAGIDTHALPPSHNLYQPQPPAAPSSTPDTSSARPLAEWLRVVPQHPDAPVAPLRRALTPQERTGVYALLGLVGAAYALSALVA